MADNWPWDSFPEDQSTWEACKRKYDELKEELEKKNGIIDSIDSCISLAVEMSKDKDVDKRSIEHSALRDIRRHIKRGIKK